MPVTVKTIEKATTIVRSFFDPSPLTHSHYFTELLGQEVFFKWDNQLRTGSFKERGVINFLSSLSPTERRKGVVAASAGNHAIALAYYSKKMKVPCNVIMPTWAPMVKIRAAEKYGANVRLYGSSFQEAYDEALAVADKQKITFVSAYNDERIVNGQGSCGLEILAQTTQAQQKSLAVVVPIGGGGLISGIATAIKQLHPHIQIIGVQSRWVVEARKSGKRVAPFPPSSIADGIAVKTIGTVTAPIIKRYVDQIVTVDEDEIGDAIIKLLELEKTVIEGAGAAALAALLAKKVKKLPHNIVAVTCGSNIDMDLVSRLLTRDLIRKGRSGKIAFSVPDRPGSLNYITQLLSKAGANVIEVSHDRVCTELPGHVSIEFLLEHRDKQHKKATLALLRESGLRVEELF
jgi:threonine dehydratase